MVTIGVFNPLVAAAQAAGQRPDADTTAQGPLKQAQDSALRAAESAREAKEAAAAARTDWERSSKETIDALKDVKAAAERASVELGRGETLSNQANTIMSFFEIVVVVLGLLAGYEAFSWAKRARTAETTMKKVDEKLEQLGQTGEALQQQLVFLNAMRSQVERSFTQIQERLSDLFTPGVYLIGGPKEPPPQGAYDDDALIAFSAQIDLTGRDNKALFDVLVLSARYWRRYDEFGRATGRARRAIEVIPTSPDAHHQLGRALWQSVATSLINERKSKASDARHIALLTEARNEIAIAEALRPDHLRGYEEAVYDQACIARFLGEIKEATALYRLGIERSRARAAHEGHAADFEFDFALACLFATERMFTEAFDLLASIVDKKERWDEEWRRLVPCDYVSYIQEDMDIAEMRADEEWGKRLETLYPEKPLAAS